MASVTVTTTSGSIVRITAPEGKTMVADPGLLSHGILSIGEYGPSGQKIAAFKDWTVMVYDDSGYTLEEVNPF